MVCFNCGEKTIVVNSRINKIKNNVWRRRKCINCLKVFTTHELAKYSDFWLVKTDMNKVFPFSRDRIFVNILNSLEKDLKSLEVASHLTDTVINKLAKHVSSSVIKSSDIKQVVQVTLSRYSSVASLKYSFS